MGLEEIAINLGIDAVKKFFDRKKDDKDDKNDKDLISVGLAVGYFYNFIDVISDVIQGNRVIVLHDNPGDKDGRQYDAEMVEMQIILPVRLDVGVYARCEQDFNETKKAFIFLQKQKRWYGINYNRTQHGKKNGIIITDLARPLMAVKRFYEEILGYQTHDAADTKWLKAQLSEIKAFKETLTRLQQRGYGALVNRLTFSEKM